jgi:predicted ArsR family transcriptional regulator
MADALLEMFSWLTTLLADPSIGEIQLEPVERAILEKFRRGWGTTDTAGLLRSLSLEYGEGAGKTIEKVLAKRIKKDWGEIGAREAHPGTEIADFIRILWEPLERQGFVFIQKRDGRNVEFCVTKCPVKDLAEQTGLHQWLYHLACATDLYSTTAFSSKIEFRRTKTLMEGRECCNHTYIAK